MNGAGEGPLSAGQRRALDMLAAKPCELADLEEAGTSLADLYRLHRAAFIDRLEVMGRVEWHLNPKTKRARNQKLAEEAA